MTDFPADVRDIRDAEAGRPRRVWPFVHHRIQYTYGRGESAILLATFTADGPLPFPAEGQVIDLHGVRVKVIEALVSYYAAADGAPVVSAAVRVESASLFPTTEES